MNISSLINQATFIPDPSSVKRPGVRKPQISKGRLRLCHSSRLLDRRLHRHMCSMRPGRRKGQDLGSNKAFDMPPKKTVLAYVPQYTVLADDAPTGLFESPRQNRLENA